MKHRLNTEGNEGSTRFGEVAGRNQMVRGKQWGERSSRYEPLDRTAALRAAAATCARRTKGNPQPFVGGVAAATGTVAVQFMGRALRHRWFCV
ncbi:MAG: hypothetical protein EBS05_06290 [Proteobacteria bacterium]|nr:hypothetical protein [Pseudomonadota bacterium]